jgi:hypothetical protein
LGSSASSVGPSRERSCFGAETIRQLAPQIAMQASPPAPPFFQFHAGGDPPPLFFFNGDLVSGGHSSVRRMVELLGPDYLIISIDPHGLRGEPIPLSIEEMAADRLPLILKRLASGPFGLGGNGPMVAFEAARPLMAAATRLTWLRWRPVDRQRFTFCAGRWNRWRSWINIPRRQRAGRLRSPSARFRPRCKTLIQSQGAVPSGTARGSRGFLRGRTRRSAVVASLVSTRSGPGAWGASWLPDDCRGTAG